MAIAIELGERDPLLVGNDQDAATNESVAKTHEVFRVQERQLDHPERLTKKIYASLVPSGRILVKVSIVVGIIVIVGFVATGIYLSRARPISTGIVCRPTQVPFLNQIEPGDPNQLSSNATFIPSQIVDEEVFNAEESFQKYERIVQEQWKYLNPELEAKLAAILAKRSKTLGESLTTCMTGEVYGSLSFDETLAQFMSLPYSPTDQFQTLFVKLRYFNQNFSQPIDNQLFIEIMDRFRSNAQLRDKHEMLNTDRNWFIANFEPWIGTITNALTAYSKAVSNPFFKDLDPLVTATIGYQSGLKELALAPPRNQVVGLQQVQDKVMARLCEGGLNEKEREDFLALHWKLMDCSCFAQYSALTGKTYSGTPNQDNFCDTTLSLFHNLYSWEHGDSFNNFKRVWVNSLQYFIDQGEKGFEEGPVQDLIYALQSVAESRNGTIDCYRPDRPPQTVDMLPVIELIDRGLTFGNVTWRPVRTAVG